MKVHEPNAKWQAGEGKGVEKGRSSFILTSKDQRQIATVCSKRKNPNFLLNLKTQPLDKIPGDQ